MSFLTFCPSRVSRFSLSRLACLSWLVCLVLADSSTESCMFVTMLKNPILPCVTIKVHDEILDQFLYLSNNLLVMTNIDAGIHHSFQFTIASFDWLKRLFETQNLGPGTKFTINWMISQMHLKPALTTSCLSSHWEKYHQLFYSISLTLKNHSISKNGYYYIILQRHSITCSVTGRGKRLKNVLKDPVKDVQHLHGRLGALGPWLLKWRCSGCWEPPVHVSRIQGPPPYKWQDCTISQIAFAFTLPATCHPICGRVWNFHVGSVSLKPM